MESQTSTAVQVGVKTAEKEIVVEAPLFILFAEYLGYVSIFNKICEDWTDGNVPELHVQKAIIVEAQCIRRQMQKDYDAELVREMYEMYYPVILQEYDEKLKELIKD